MKVLQFINSLSAGGAERLLVDSAIAYHKRGVEVDILLIKGGPSPFRERLKPYPNIKILALSESASVYNPKHIFYLNRLFKNYNIIHVHLFPALYWTALAKIISKKKHKIIFTEHNTTNRRQDSFIFKKFDKIIYKQYNRIVTISDAVDKRLKMHLAKKFSNIVKIYNGINLKEIEKAIPYNRDELGFSKQDKLLLQVSSFTPQKDQPTLIKSLLHLTDDFKLLLVGNGPLQNENILLAKKLGLEKRIHFLGIRKDVPKLLKSVDLVILSSHYEGLSLASVEGLASGKPFIASNVPGLTEVVKDAGILFSDNNEEELSQKINLLVNDKKHHDNTISKCLKRSKNFDIDIMTKNYLELYKDCYRNNHDKNI